MTIEINGKTVEPVYDFGTVRIVGDITKNSNPITFNIDLNNPAEIYRYAKVSLHAGLLRANELDKAKEKVTEKQVQDVIDCWNWETVLDSIAQFNKIWKIEPKPGEEQTDTQ